MGLVMCNVKSLGSYRSGLGLGVSGFSGITGLRISSIAARL